jgi:zinc protease
VSALRAAALFLAFLGGAAGAAVPRPHRTVLDGGLELVVVPIPDARTVSLRYVVRAGAAHDPPGREGLAHVLEHVLAQGRDGALLPAARAAGAELNAFTSRDATWYVLDAPADRFPSLAERLLRSITDPRFPAHAVQRERGVIDSEEGYRRRGPDGRQLVEEAIFAHGPTEAGIIGDSSARLRIEPTDLASFFRSAYTTLATTIILTGAIEPGAAHALVERAVAIPPALPGERLEPLVVPPSLPATRRIRAPFLAAIVGYPLARSEERACEPLAELVELRLVTALRVREALARDVDVACQLLRGSPFILATVYAPTLEATDLPSRIERAFGELAAAPPAAAELHLLGRRLARLAAIRRSDPAEWADALAREAARPRGASGATALDRAVPGPISATELHRAARRAFRAEGRVILFLSPFGGERLGEEDG